MKAKARTPSTHTAFLSPIKGCEHNRTELICLSALCPSRFRIVPIPQLWHCCIFALSVSRWRSCISCRFLPFVAVSPPLSPEAQRFFRFFRHICFSSQAFVDHIRARQLVRRERRRRRRTRTPNIAFFLPFNKITTSILSWFRFARSERERRVRLARTRNS